VYLDCLETNKHFRYTSSESHPPSAACLVLLLGRLWCLALWVQWSMHCLRVQWRWCWMHTPAGWHGSVAPVCVSVCVCVCVCVCVWMSYFSAVPVCVRNLLIASWHHKVRTTSVIHTRVNYNRHRDLLTTLHIFFTAASLRLTSQPIFMKRWSWGARSPSRYLMKRWSWWAQSPSHSLMKRWSWGARPPSHSSNGTMVMMS
jgi:hypothetical protein